MCYGKYPSATFPTQYSLFCVPYQFILLSLPTQPKPNMGSFAIYYSSGKLGTILNI